MGPTISDGRYRAVESLDDQADEVEMELGEEEGNPACTNTSEDNCNVQHDRHVRMLVVIDRRGNHLKLVHHKPNSNRLLCPVNRFETDFFV